jgi:hypothetical protein
VAVTGVEKLLRLAMRRCKPSRNAHLRNSKLRFLADLRLASSSLTTFFNYLLRAGMRLEVTSCR